MFIAAFIIVGGMGLQMSRRLAGLAVGMWKEAGTQRITVMTGPRVATSILSEMTAALLPILLLTICMAALNLFAQGKPQISWGRLALKWDRLNPFTGFTRMFGKQAWVEFGKTLAKFMFVGGVLTWVAWPSFAGLDRLVGADAGIIGQSAAGIVVKMIKTAALLVGVLAAADIVYQRRSWMSRLKMSLQEIKDEHKESEGDPHIKGKRRQIAMSRSGKRMMASVPEATVVITNPTHYSVALKYDHGTMVAPIVVAKGVDAIAFKIREIAKEHKIPVLESPPLARALYATVDVDHPIPVEHYTAVAEIISYVMKLSRENKLL
jgi:flagellar biosynthetic protein FlhB